MIRKSVLLIALFFAAVIFFAPKSSTDSPRGHPEFVYARIRYHMTLDGMRMSEQPWHHDYPFGDEMFPTVLGEVSTVRTDRTSYKIVDIDSPEIFKYPFAYLSEPGFLDLNAKDAANLREWLDRGGFLLVDDLRTADFSRYTRGPEDDIAHFRQEVKKMYPDREFVPLALTDPIFNTFYQIESLDMHAPYVFDGQGPAAFLALRDAKGNIEMVIDNNNDISEFWEWLDRGDTDMHRAAESFHFGINDAIYALTH